MTANEASQQRRTVPPSGHRLHPQYNPSNLQNDIAIIITQTALTFTQFVQPIDLAPATAGSFAGELATVSGWGRTSDASLATSAQLRCVQNNVVTNAVCTATFGSSIITSTLCLSTVGGRGSCGGDSGKLQLKIMLKFKTIHIIIRWPIDHPIRWSSSPNWCRLFRSHQRMPTWTSSWIRSRFEVIKICFQYISIF